MANLVEAMQARCNELRETHIPAYEEIGPAGAFGLLMMKDAIRRAEAAIASGDVVACVSTYKELQEFEL